MQGEEPLETSENEVTEMPEQWDNWLENNKERLAKAKSIPYFITDNTHIEINRETITGLNY